MTQSNLIEQARSGNVRVLAALMNHLLKPQGMMAVVGKANDCLEILIESDKRSLTDEFRTPKKEILVSMIEKWLTTLGINSTSRVRISWQRSGQDQPAWTQEFKLRRLVKLTLDDEFDEQAEQKLELISTTLDSNLSLQVASPSELHEFEVNSNYNPEIMSSKFPQDDDATVFQFIDEHGLTDTTEQGDEIRQTEYLAESQETIDPEIPAYLPQSSATTDPKVVFSPTELEYVEYLKQTQLEDEQAPHSEASSRKSAKAGFMQIFLQYLLVCIAIVATIVGIHYIFAQSQPVKENTKAVVKTKQVL